MPFLRGDKAGAPHERLFWRSGGGARFAVREGDWKLVGGESAGLELYNLAADIGETRNVADTQPDVMARLRRAYDEWNRGNIAPIFESPRAGQPKKADKAKPSARKKS
jgi:arylsulfatase A-like enzyme